MVQWNYAVFANWVVEEGDFKKKKIISVTRARERMILRIMLWVLKGLFKFGKILLKFFNCVWAMVIIVSSVQLYCVSGMNYYAMSFSKSLLFYQLFLSNNICPQVPLWGHPVVKLDCPMSPQIVCMTGMLREGNCLSILWFGAASPRIRDHKLLPISLKLQL